MTNTAARLAWRCGVAIIVVANSGFASAAPVQWTVASGGSGHYYEAFNQAPLHGTNQEPQRRMSMMAPVIWHRLPQPPKTHSYSRW